MSKRSRVPPPRRPARPGGNLAAASAARQRVFGPEEAQVAEGLGAPDGRLGSSGLHVAYAFAVLGSAVFSPRSAPKPEPKPEPRPPEPPEPLVAPGVGVASVTPWSFRQLVNAWNALLSPPAPPRCPVNCGRSDLHASSAFCVAASGDAPPAPPNPPPKPPPNPPPGRPLGPPLGRPEPEGRPEGRLNVGRSRPCCDRHCRYASIACAPLPSDAEPDADAAGETLPEDVAPAADPDDPEDDEHALSSSAPAAASTATAAPARSAADVRAVSGAAGCGTSRRTSSGAAGCRMCSGAAGCRTLCRTSSRAAGCRTSSDCRAADGRPGVQVMSVRLLGSAVRVGTGRNGGAGRAARPAPPRVPGSARRGCGTGGAGAWGKPGRN